MDEEQNIEEQSHELSALSGKPENKMEVRSEDSNLKENSIQTQPDPQLQTATHQIQTENMEVHHSHHPSHKKKWTEYLLEFFMLFLAVFLGFVAENIREHFIEKRKEKIYMNGFISDLQSDSTVIPDMINYIKLADKQLDTLMYLISSKKIREKAPILYRLALQNRSVQFFQYTNATFEQLKSSGNFGLITEKTLAAGLIKYDNTIHDLIKKQEERWLRANANQTDYQWQILDATAYTSADSIHVGAGTTTASNSFFSRVPVITKTDEINLVKLYNLFFEKRLILPAYLDMMQALKDENKHLLAEIEKNYSSK